MAGPISSQASQNLLSNTQTLINRLVMDYTQGERAIKLNPWQLNPFAKLHHIKASMGICAFQLNPFAELHHVYISYKGFNGYIPKGFTN